MKSPKLSFQTQVPSVQTIIKKALILKLKYKMS